MEPELIFSEHAVDRMLDWDLDVADIAAAYLDGETIEEYETVRGWSSAEPVSAHSTSSCRRRRPVRRSL